MLPTQQLGGRRSLLSSRLEAIWAILHKLSTRLWIIYNRSATANLLDPMSSLLIRWIVLPDPENIATPPPDLICLRRFLFWIGWIDFWKLKLSSDCEGG